MSQYKKVDKTILAKQNKRNVLSCIARKGPINRAAIAKQTNLSIPAVMAITEELIALGLVRSQGKGESTGGKRPELLSIAPDYSFSIGVDVGRSTLRVIVANFGGEMIYSVQEPTGEVLPESRLIHQIVLLVKQAIIGAGIHPSKVSGVGVAMPGLIEQQTGRVLLSPDFGWDNVPLHRQLCDALPYEIVVENANRVRAIAENMTKWEEGHTKHFCINLGHGIGGALVYDGKPFYGSSGTSGEIGHITVDKDGPLCACGNSGCLESMASGDAIARQARNALLGGVSSILSEEYRDNLSALDAKAVFEAAKAGDGMAANIVGRATEFIAIGIAAVVNLLDPDVVTLFGGLTQNGPYFTVPLLEAVKRRQMKQAGRHVVFEVSDFGELGTAVGAAWMISVAGG